MTNQLLSYALALLGSYIMGSIPFGLIIGKLNGIDIRSQGSGNIGATNVGRCIGKSWGLLCFVLDFCKGGGPVLLIATSTLPLTGQLEYLQICAAVGAVCGHIFCPYLKFKGGKGIATAAGALCVLSWPSIVIAFAVWLTTLIIWRYVGLSSVLAAAALPITAIAMKLFCGYHKPATSAIGLFIAIGALAIYKHKANIGRLIQGTEPKIGSKKKTEGTQVNEASSS